MELQSYPIASGSSLKLALLSLRQHYIEVVLYIFSIRFWQMQLPVNRPKILRFLFKCARPWKSSLRYGGDDGRAMQSVVRVAGILVSEGGEITNFQKTRTATTIKQSV